MDLSCEQICRGSQGWLVVGGDLSVVCFSFPMFAEHKRDVTEIYNKAFAPPWTSSQVKILSHINL